MTEPRTIENLLAQLPAFQGLDRSYLELVAACGANDGFGAGEQLFREGDPADSFHVVRRGRISLEVFVPNRGTMMITTLGAGELVGWSWLFPPYRWHFDARATEPTRTIAFDGACLRGKCEQDHDLGYELMRRFASLMLDRLQATRLQLLDVYGRAPVG
jgi:CRP-like cAMP-binding protein